MPALVPPSAAPLAVSTAAAVVTVNHPLGLAAVLAGTPVLHMGRTPYGVRGVSQRTSIDLLGDEFLEAVNTGDPIAIHEDGTVEVG